VRRLGGRGDALRRQGGPSAPWPPPLLSGERWRRWRSKRLPWYPSFPIPLLSRRPSPSSSSCSRWFVPRSVALDAGSVVSSSGYGAGARGDARVRGGAAPGADRRLPQACSSRRGGTALAVVGLQSYPSVFQFGSYYKTKLQMLLYLTTNTCYYTVYLFMCAFCCAAVASTMKLTFRR